MLVTIWGFSLTHVNHSQNLSGQSCPSYSCLKLQQTIIQTNYYDKKIQSCVSEVTFKLHSAFI